MTRNHTPLFCPVLKIHDLSSEMGVDYCPVSRVYLFVLNSKLKKEEEQVQAELEEVFGSGLEHEVEKGPGESGSDSNQTAIIALGVLLALSIVGLVVCLTVSVMK